jgi:hypothetical protein
MVKLATKKREFSRRVSQMGKDYYRQVIGIEELRDSLIPEFLNS